MKLDHKIVFHRQNLFSIYIYIGTKDKIFMKTLISFLNNGLPRQPVTLFSLSCLFDVTHFKNTIFRHFEFRNTEFTCYGGKLDKIRKYILSDGRKYKTSTCPFQNTTKFSICSLLYCYIGIIGSISSI